MNCDRTGTFPVGEILSYETEDGRTRWQVVLDSLGTLFPGDRLGSSIQGF